MSLTRYGAVIHVVTLAGQKRRLGYLALWRFMETNTESSLSSASVVYNSFLGPDTISGRQCELRTREPLGWDMARNEAGS